MGLDAFLAAVERDPGAAGLFSDFDGTLSHIVADRTTVEPVPGVVDRLHALSRHLGRVAVVSGRPVQFLQRFFGADLELSGLYGIEHWSDGELTVDQQAIEWLPAVRSTVSDAVAEFGPSVVEDKNYSLTLHYRHDPDATLRGRIERWSSDRARSTGLEARVARMSVELHPPIDRSKAHAVDAMLDGLTSVVYLGDDVGDLPAFAHIGELVTATLLEVGAAVLITSDETVPELREVATDLVDGPDAAVAVLDSILEVARRA